MRSSKSSFYDVSTHLNFYAPDMRQKKGREKGAGLHVTKYGLSTKYTIFSTAESD